MSIISKWALQAVVLFLLGWMATVATHWSHSVVSGTGSDRLAELNSGALSNPAALATRDSGQPRSQVE
ncbi:MULTISPECIES: hypothetical protein [Pseudomonas syringae group]|uniref:Uncharacterized protein n=1 Tax=Pseudomonas syringae pv. primulae TaxID=251707 RepID=A0A0P9YHV2_9PSED|nr:MULTISPECIES: hypothetical protein [Pseudomonas syringae group]KPY37395.1 Uncharacterized protein ALO52_01022 [Pseudomonas syringae pv. primulae]MBD8187546.1 hypothetical protein [Pseudomonas viridiflava]QXG33591.1 hypothetical protein KTT61_15920 [Pseudomonas viridiflava]QXG41800.1 hypothetical protein KTT55_04630 [Pseudomonas viridiflava]